MTKYHISLLLFSGFALGVGSAVAQVEQVTELTVSNPPAMVATIDQYVATEEGDADSVTLLQHLNDGTNPSTHTIVGIYDDLEAMESTMRERETSVAWSTTQRAASAIVTVNSSTLAIQRKTWGRNAWREGEYLAAVLVNAPDEPRWMTAMDELMQTTDVDNPGMIRVVRLRAGPSTHAVLLVSSTFSGLITHIEDMEASEEFASMIDRSTIQQVGMNIYRVARVWNP